MIVFRENTEDVYAGIEYQAGTPEAKKLLEFLRDELGANVDSASGVGIKPMTEPGSKRLVQKAIEHALEHKRESVTLVHKGNIMKFTEGAFRSWGYELAAQKFSDFTMTEAEAADGKDKPLVIKDRIADAMFQEVLLRPEQYSVIATTNLNGDYISDALAAQVGGLGIAPGVNMGVQAGHFRGHSWNRPHYRGQGHGQPHQYSSFRSNAFEPHRLDRGRQDYRGRCPWNHRSKDGYR